MRCVGVGKSRQHDTRRSDVPVIYRATRWSSTPPAGGPGCCSRWSTAASGPASGWRDEAVKDALDLCLACKGCKGDCPVEVDMATYKAEFPAHYYAGRLRPAAHYATGWLPAAAHGTIDRLGLARTVNALARIKPLRRAGSRMAVWRTETRRRSPPEPCSSGGRTDRHPRGQVMAGTVFAPFHYGHYDPDKGRPGAAPTSSTGSPTS